MILIRRMLTLSRCIIVGKALLHIAKNLTLTATYAAFIKNHGTHCTAAAGHRCWNTELIETANVLVYADWTKLDQTIAKGIMRYLENVTESMEKVVAEARVD
jgi:hypothetical protein